MTGKILADVPVSLVNTLPVVESPYLPEGTCYVTRTFSGRAEVLLVGGYLDPVQKAGREARMIVRRGLADVLEWLGEPVELPTVMSALRDRMAAS
ncbi:hypothetical protein [Kribbella deserti]|uniref:DUF5753 domain-containing protein n=1 Tax=Kribbella deserti TaxID=1926257 RepID=A0ABV6QND7_9ACTN